MVLSPQRMQILLEEQPIIPLRSTATAWTDKPARSRRTATYRHKRLPHRQAASARSRLSLDQSKPHDDGSFRRKILFYSIRLMGASPFFLKSSARCEDFRC